MLVINELHLLDGMRCPEAIKRMDNRVRGIDGCEVRSNGHVHRLLDVLGNHDRASRLPDSHDIGVVSVDRQRVRSNRACGNVEDGGQMLPSHLVHVGDHQQEALGRRVGGGQQTRAESSVQGACSSPLGVHLLNPEGLAERILAALGSPGVDILGHGGRRRDRVDYRCIREEVGHMGSRVTAVYRRVDHRHLIYWGKML
eukprot:XP_001708947.1 Hypothetical protein GL50803_39432 [Giardia lamblia ATCC 50803]